jgi:hypothetical protein
VGTEFSFNFLSEAERIRISESAQKIKRLQAQRDARRGRVSQTSALLPPALDCDPQSTRPTSAPPGETSANNSSLKGDPDGVSLRSVMMRPCRHGIFHHQCPTCAAFGW